MILDLYSSTLCLICVICVICGWNLCCFQSQNFAPKVFKVLDDRQVESFHFLASVYLNVCGTFFLHFQEAPDYLLRSSKGGGEYPPQDNQLRFVMAFYGLVVAASESRFLMYTSPRNVRPAFS